MGLFSQNAPAKPKTEREPDVPMLCGTQIATVQHAMSGHTAKGKTKFSVKFANEEGKTAWLNLYVSPESEKALEILYKQLSVFGLESKYLDDPSVTPDEIAEAMIGAEALVTVVDEPYNGNVYRKIKWIEPTP